MARTTATDTEPTDPAAAGIAAAVDVTGDASGAVQRWSRRTTWTLAVLVVALCAALPFTTHPWHEATTDTNDAAMYLACARSIADGEGYAYLGEPFSIRPPGWSLVLAPIVAARGYDLALIHGLTGLLAVAAAAAVFAWSRARLGTACAAALALAVWANPFVQRFANRAMSDVPGLACLFALFLVARWAARRPSWRREVVLGLAIGLGAYLRTIHVFVVPAVIAARLLAPRAAAATGADVASGLLARRLPPLRTALLVLVPVLVLLPWSLRNAALAPGGPVDQNYIASYGTAMWHVDGGDPESPRRPASEILGRVPERARQVAATLGSRMQDQDAGPAAIVLGGLLLGALALVAVRRRAPAELFALGVLPVLLTYFGYKPRLVLPLFPVALAALAEVAILAAARFTGVRVARALAAAGLVVLALVDADFTTDRERARQTDTVFREMAASVQSQLAPDAVLAAPIGWHDAVYLERPVWSLFFAARRADDMQAAEAVIDRYGINTVVLDARVSSDAAMLPWFAERYAPVDTTGPTFVFRVRP